MDDVMRAMLGIDSGINQFAWMDPNRRLRVWCQNCKRSIDTVAMMNAYSPCQYCGDTRAKLHTDPIAVPETRSSE